MKKLAKILIPIFVLALVMSCIFIFASAAGQATVYDAEGTSVFDGSLVDAVAYVNTNSQGDGALTIKLNSDVKIDGTEISVTAQDFTLDLNGKKLSFWAGDGNKALFVVSVPADAECSVPLIKGNGTVHVKQGKLFKAVASQNDQWVMFSMGAREALDDDYNALDVVPVDTIINVNLQGTTVADFANTNDSFYAQGVKFYNKGVVGFNLNQEATYVRLVDSEWQAIAVGYSAPSTSGTQKATIANITTSGSYVQLDNTYVRTRGALFNINGSVNSSEDAEFEILRINDSYLNLGGFSGEAWETTGSLTNSGSATTYGVLALRGTTVNAYRFVEQGNGENNLSIYLEKCVHKQRDHGTGPQIFRGNYDVYAVDTCFENNRGIIQHTHANGDTDYPTFTFINCRFTSKQFNSQEGRMTNAAGELGKAVIAYDLSNTYYPVIVNPTTDPGTKYFSGFNFDADNVQIWQTGTHFTENSDGSFTLVQNSGSNKMSESYVKIGQGEVRATGDHNRYYLYSVTDPYAGTSKAATDGKIIMNAVVDNNMRDTAGGNTLNDPYFTLGAGYSDGKTNFTVATVADGVATWNEGAMIVSFDLTGGDNGYADLTFNYFCRLNGGATPIASFTVKENVLTGNKKSLLLSADEWVHITVVFVIDKANTTLTAKSYVDGELFDEYLLIAPTGGKKATTAITSQTWMEGIRLQPTNTTPQTIGAGFGLDNIYTVVYNNAASLPTDFTPAEKLVYNYEAEYGGVEYATLGEAIDAAPAGQYVDIIGNVTSEISLEQAQKAVFYTLHKDFQLGLTFAPTISAADLLPQLKDGNLYGAVIDNTNTDAVASLQFKDFSYSDIYDGGIKAYVRYDYANPLTGLSYTVLDKDGAVLKVATNMNAFSYDMRNLEDGQTIKLYDNVTAPNNAVALSNGIAYTLDLNGFTFTLTMKANVFNVNGAGATFNIKSSRPGGAIVAYLDETNALKNTSYNYSLNSGLGFINVNNANVTVNIDGENLSFAGTTLLDVDSSASKAWENIKININGGVYIQEGYDVGGIFHTRNESVVKYDIRNATFILEGLNQSYVFTNYKNTNGIFEAVLDGCTIVDNNNNSKSAIVNTIRDNSSVTVRNSHLALVSTSGDSNINFTGNDTNAAYISRIIIGENVTSTIAFPAGITFEEGCAGNRLTTAYNPGFAGKDSITALGVNTYFHGALSGAKRLHRYGVKIGNTTHYILVVQNDAAYSAGTTTIEGAIAKGLVIYNPLNIVSDADLASRTQISNHSTMKFTAGSAKYLDYCWGFDEFRAEDVTYTMASKHAANYSSTVKTVAYTYAGTSVKEIVVPTAMSDEQIKALPVPTVSAGGVEGVYAVGGFKAANVTEENGKVTVEMTATAVENKLALSSTLILQNNLTYTILLKEEAMPYLRGFKIGEENIMPEDTKLVSYNGVNYYALYKTVTPAEVGTEYAITVTYAVSGVEGISTNTVNWTLSVANYAKAVLTAEGNATVNGEAKQLVAEVLNYIKTLDEYASRTTNENIAAAIAAYTEAGFAPAEIETLASDAVVDIANVSGIGLKIGEEGFKFYMTFDEGFTGTVNVKIGEQTYAADASAGEFTVAVHAYALVRDITIGEQTYNLESYFEYMINDNVDITEHQFNLVSAIKAYAIAADAYMVSMEVTE